MRQLIIPENAVVVVTRVSVGKMTLLSEPMAVNQDLTGLVVRDTTQLHTPFLFWALKGCVDRIVCSAQGLGVKGVTRQFIAGIEIPLPPVEIQQQIVAELDGYRKVIEGARQVIANYKPTIKIDPKWPVVKLGELITGKPKNGYSGKPVDYPTRIKVLSLSATTSGRLDPARFKYLDEEIGDASPARCRKGDILLQRGNTAELVGTAALFDVADEDYIYPDLMIRIRADETIVRSEYLVAALQTPAVRAFLRSNASGSAGSMPKINQAIVESIPIALPPLAIQRRVVAELEAERKLVEANRELIMRMEAKTRARLAEVWGEEATDAA